MLAIIHRPSGSRWLAALVLSAALGCGGANTAAPQQSLQPPRADDNSVAQSASPTSRKKVSPTEPEEKLTPTRVTPSPAPSPAPRGASDSPPNLGDLLQTPPGQEDLNFYTAAPPPTIDEERVKASGIRKLRGQHLTLYTDLPAAPDVDELPQVFDLAVPQWAEYFHVAPSKSDDWMIWGYLIVDKEKFRTAGLYPDDLPEFPHGFQRAHEFWLFEQPSAYYRRHLMLHEGTHAAMYHWLAGAGPPWYCEGMAELFGTHRWADGKLTTRYMPQSKDEVPQWGRIKLIRDAYDANRALLIHDVLKLPPDAHRLSEAYAWSWAAAYFFDTHPRYQQAFRNLTSDVKTNSVEFSTRFLTALKDDVPTMQTEWQLLIGNCEYGYDVAANALEVKPAAALPATGAQATISAAHAWQSSGVLLEAGKTYRIMAAGRYELGTSPKTWWCEPGGVTVRYHRGLPLGMLVGAVRNDAEPEALTPLIKPQPLGLSREITPNRSGTLWLKINEFEGEWADNVGSLTVEIQEVK